jgi:hypothetical protein
MKRGLTLDGLIEDFIKTHSSASYFELEPFIQRLRMAYCIGLDEVHVHNRKPVIRSDGEKYPSITHAAKDNLLKHKSSITKAIKFNKKCAGYFWKYA